MSQYYTLVAGLRELSLGGEVRGWDAGAVVDEIREGVSARDRVLVDALLSGEYTPQVLARSRFLQEWSAFDRQMRGALATLVARRLGLKSESQYVVNEEVKSIAESGNILERERALDRLRWMRAEQIAVFNYFDIDAVLAYLVKVQILRRWTELDPQRGREKLTAMIDAGLESGRCPVDDI